MKLKKRLREIYGLPITYQFADLKKEGDLGEFDDDKHVITLDNSLDGQELLRVKFHEELHVIRYRLFKNLELTEREEEMLFDAIDTLLFEHYIVTERD